MAARKRNTKAGELGNLLARVAAALHAGGEGLDGFRSFVESLEKSSAEYRKTHWGQKPREIVLVDAADPSGSLALPALGRLWSITYETRKGKDRTAVLYEHEFKKPYPLLLYAPHQKGRLIIAGGGYRVDERGIIG